MRQRGGLPVEVDGGLGALGVGALPARSEASRHADASGGEPGVVREGDGGGLRAGRRVPHAREVEPPGGASLESWARLDDLTVRATRALNIGVYGPSEGVRPTSPLLSRLLESNSPVVEHVRTDKTFSDQSPHIRPRVASSILIILPRARDPALAADGQSTAMYLCYMPPMNPAYVEAEPRPLLPRPRASQATTNFCRVFLRVRTYQISLPPSLPVGSMYVLLDLTQETSLSSVLQLPLAL